MSSEFRATLSHPASAGTLQSNPVTAFWVALAALFVVYSDAWSTREPVSVARSGHLGLELLLGDRPTAHVDTRHSYMPTT